jgi:CRP-like cAMP-binding protein
MLDTSDGVSRMLPDAPTAVAVLAADPDLAIGIEPDQRPAALAAAVAPVFDFDRGPWRFSPPAEPAALGALVLAGMITVRIDGGTRAHVELLGEGDVVSPWVGNGIDQALPSAVNAVVASRLKVAMLSHAFALRTARWPEIRVALMQRLIVRTRRLSLQAAINSLSRIEERLELTLWELAYRFGHVTPEGIAVELPLTHSQLAEMLAAQRPSVASRPAVAR